MTLLHAYFHFRNQQAFHRLLDGSGRGQSTASTPLSTSAGKSWNRPSPLSGRPPLDVNARDAQGCAVLHLAAAATDPAATEYVRMLLAHPHINVNFQDVESHWTALHRALYHGNIETAILLLQRPDIDTALKDSEGYTAFDLYNSTVEGTKPNKADKHQAELFTWGANRNAALGLGDGDDRSYPEQVVVRPTSTLSTNEHVDARFAPIHVSQTAMSKLHTVVVTDEGRGSVRVCGFGSGGRLGLGQHTQYSLVPISQFTQVIVAVAVGQDHTLALTKSGEVFSWGLNRFSQLGYVVEVTEGKRSDEPIQAVPRKITGPLKNRVVKGVTACKTASACWTDREVYTWGTNNGQLGYDRSAHPVQIPPRVVTKVSQPVISCTVTDSVLACLLVSKDVVCVWNDGHFKLNFPAYTFPSEIAVYRPPQAVNNSSIEKITSCDNVLAALSTNGELFTWTTPSPPEGSSSSSKPFALPQPQRVWALRKQYSAVKDVALGSDGSLAVCTEAGHVYVRSRNMKAGQSTGAKTFKFQRVPFLQRVVEVCANSTGAYGALRVDFAPQPIQVIGNMVTQDLEAIQPFTSVPLAQGDQSVDLNSSDPLATTVLGAPSSDNRRMEDLADDNVEDSAIQKDIRQLEQFISLLDTDQRLRCARGTGLFDDSLAHGADVFIAADSFDFPAHRVILAARSSVLERLLAGGPPVAGPYQLSVKLSPGIVNSLPTVVFANCQPLTALILVSYLYSDEVLALWDGRIGAAVLKRATSNIKPAQVKTELLALAHMLDLPFLAQAVEPPVKRAPVPSMVTDLRTLYEASQAHNSDSKGIVRHPLAPDVLMEFKDKTVRAHSVILRSRSAFFAAFFDQEVWTAKRRSASGVVQMQFKHMKWRAVEPVMRFLCCGEDSELFSVLDTVRSVDELLDYVFEVMSVANELLLDRLVLLCSAVILKRINTANVCSLLSDASHFYAMPLVRSIHFYMAANMDLLLERRMLDELTPDLVRKLSAFVRQQQVSKYPTSRSTKLVDKAMEAHKAWLATQDIPSHIIPTVRPGAFRDTSKPSPSASTKKDYRQSRGVSPTASPTIRPQASKGAVNSPFDDGVFMMDEPDSLPSPISGREAPRLPMPSTESPSKSSGWKNVSSAPRVDMRVIMANRGTQQATSQGSTPPATPRPFGVRRGNVHVPHGSEARPASAASPPTLAQRAIPIESPPASPPSHAPIAGRGHASPGPTPSGSVPGTPRLLSSKTARRPPAVPGLGPVFTPAKQAAIDKGNATAIRRSVSAHTSRNSHIYAEIRYQERLGLDAAPRAARRTALGVKASTKDKRSLREIQEEEHALQVEADFLKWWTAEEERIRAEEMQGAQASAEPQKRRKPRQSKGKTPQPTGATTDGQQRTQDRSEPSTEKKRPTRRPKQTSPGPQRS